MISISKTMIAVIIIFSVLSLSFTEEALPDLEKSANKFKIGIVTFIPEENEKEEDLDGDEESIGKPAKDVAEIVVEAINEGTFPHSPSRSVFGPKGVQIELVFLDEAEEDPKDTVGSYENFVEEHDLDLVIGYTFSDNCEEIAPKAEELKIFTILFDCGTTQIFESIVTEPKYLFRTASHATMSSVAVARYIAKYYPDIKVIGGINEDYLWGEDSWNTFESSLKQLIDIEDSTSRFVPRRAGNYCDDVTSLMDSVPRPELIFSSFAGESTVRLLEDMKDCPLYPGTVLVLTTGQAILPRLEDYLVANPESIIIFGGRGAAGELIAENELGTWLDSHFEPESRPNYHSRRMMQALTGVKKAYEKAVGDTGKLPEKEEVINALKGLHYESLNGPISMVLSSGHQSVQENAVATLRIDSDGKPVINEDEIQRFKAWCVNPPPHMNSKEWIESGFEGAVCDLESGF